YGPPRRISNGVDFNRLLLICAVLTRRAGVGLYNQDVIVNVTGGIRISEPAADLGIAMAIASSFRDARLLPGTVAVGEIGLSGELRSVPQMDRRIVESARLGFTRCIIPSAVKKIPRAPDGLEIIRASSISEALKVGLEKKSIKKDHDDE
ncbi:MAG: magnesium chelatase domain-containing protein, partial [Dehalococcoidia bacterium]